MIGSGRSMQGVIIGAKIARKAPDSAVKLEQLKFIDLLFHNKGLDKPDDYFVIEESFKLYYGTYIPIEIIKLLAGLEERFFAFSLYEKVATRISFNKETGKIKSLSEQGKYLRMGALFSVTITLVHCCFLLFVIALLMIQSTHMYVNIMGVSFAVIGCSFLYVAYLFFDKMIGVRPDLQLFESKLDGHFEPTELNKTDKIIILSSVIFISGIWIIKAIYL